jgi:hypothetical protein
MEEAPRPEQPEVAVQPLALLARFAAPLSMAERPLGACTALAMQAPGVAEGGAVVCGLPPSSPH